MQSTVDPIKHDCLIFGIVLIFGMGLLTKSHTVRPFEKNKGKYIKINTIKVAVIMPQTNEHILFVQRSSSSWNWSFKIKKKPVSAFWKVFFTFQPNCVFCLQSSQNMSAQQAPARGGALSWRKWNLRDAGVTICVRPTRAAALTLTSNAWKQVSLKSLCSLSHPGLV